MTKNSPFYTDHKPLIQWIKISTSNGFSKITKVDIDIKCYNYALKYKSGKRQGNVDALSRFLLPDSPAATPTSVETVAVIEH